MRDDDYGQGDLPPPDWDRVIVKSRAQGGATSPLGDPLRWGAMDQRVIAPPVLPVEVTETGQIIRVQALDGYPRNWSFAGNLTLPATTWAAPVPDFGVVMEVTQGTGQATVVQEINLRLLTTIGLSVYQPQNPGLGLETRSFAGIGAIIGNAIGVRLRYGAVLGVPGLPATVSTTIILTPYAAGSGL